MHFVEKEYLILDVFSKHRKLNWSKSKLYNGELGNNFYSAIALQHIVKKFSFSLPDNFNAKRKFSIRDMTKGLSHWFESATRPTRLSKSCSKYLFWLQEQKLQVHEPCWFDKTVLKFSLLVWTNLLTTCNCCVWTPQLWVILLVCVPVAETGMFWVWQKTFFPCVLTWVPLENLSYLGTLKLLLVCSCNGFDRSPHKMCS